MEPRIQYAKTADGVSIAFWTLGEGMPLLCHASLPWQPYPAGVAEPGVRRWYERLAEKQEARAGTTAGGRACRTAM